ncbi:bifunctional oligoribonuclease/PAP phosphatase NrnA [Marivirga salinae]|uniref:Bifunctional oligoribonuclease/PAP phosphatase NrnA n=1 Tax=Marivirga salinarum TaxID=3059078 RepID=A0AA51NE29_9BACT|nr:bifunctional oligoribonuclease/PAP phosphatase NrnA [Marivirga sp. BDSF4-3]WMN12265.1 bifunctional oligoribonuclease/PAP phosphatase NrnA [Marivirga sp. BDSF4-3]
MNIYLKIAAEIKAANNIIITSHKSPDGDSVGSSLGLLHFIEKLGKTATVCHPDPAPKFLHWLDTSSFLVMTEQPEAVTKAFEAADLIFCLDYNASNRIGSEMQALLEAKDCKTIMIDHHLAPELPATLSVSETTASSTAELIVELIEESGHGDLLDQSIGTPLYLGILTDTGSFRFPSTTPRTHEVLAKLLASGVEQHLIHEALSDNNTATKLRLQGYAMSKKMEILEDYNVAIISLSKEELSEYQYQKGDTDNLANQALSIQGMKAAIVFTERDGIMKISFRSKGEENAVNILASEHFNGGGHANAAGGMSELGVEETMEKIRGLIPEYF